MGSPAGPLVDSWRRSSGHAFLIAVALFVLVLAGIALQAAGEYALRGLHVLALSPAVSFRDTVDLYRRNLIPMAGLISMGYLITTVLMTAARAHLYRCLSGASPGA